MADEKARLKKRPAARPRRPSAQAAAPRPGLDEGEKSLHALGLAATPEERWELWAKQMRSHGYWQPLKPT